MIKWLLIILIVLMYLVGGERGIKCILTLIGNVLVLLMIVFLVFLGVPSVIATIIGGIAICSMTLFFQNDENVKTKSAFIAVCVVMILFFAFAFIIGYGGNINGFNELDSVENQLYYDSDINIDMMKLGVSVIILGLLGAVIDSAMAISSGVNEVYENNKHLTLLELFESGLNVGKDIIGTTMNTLFFAYIGETLMLYILAHAMKYDLATFLNSKIFFFDITCILFSALGCIIIIPLSALITSYELTKQDIE